MSIYFLLGGHDIPDEKPRVSRVRIDERTDFEIMKARTLAKLRGATPADVQAAVFLLETENLMKYERNV